MTVEKDRHKRTVHIGVIGSSDHSKTTLTAAIKMVLEQHARREQIKAGQADEKEGDTDAQYTGSDEC